ncbi:hypothetical protein J4T87_0021310 (plasmid) [Rhizobium sp. T1473]|uniref:hypothetical protein n=1 Tax=Rhizobium sp. T1473 TaxID=555321 RepID=UPI001AAE8886|nr:hypothetical protein [Rhizobium sp. T1473]MCA0806129.1 hypothetical protein [Rhizobium sp. T1473]
MSTSTHLNAPISFGDDQRITVTDRTHPLYGRDFVLAAGPSSVGPFRQLLVVYRDDVFLKIPISATNLYPSAPDVPSAKLSTASVRDFIRLVIGAKAQAPQSSDDMAEHDSLTSETESPLSKPHGSLEGEP